MDADAVVAHYESKGYQVAQKQRVRDERGNLHFVDILVQGRLGSLVVALEDEGGFEGPEMGDIKRIGRALGATPVVAATRITAVMRQMATRLGVVILDANTLQHEAPTRQRVVERELPAGAAGTAALEDAEPAPATAWPSRAKGGRKDADADAGTQTPWPNSGRSRPVVEATMEPVEVDDLLRFWRHDGLTAPSLTEQALSRHGNGLWSSGRPGDKPLETAEPTATLAEDPAETTWRQQAPAPTPAAKKRPDVGGASADAAAGFGWLQKPDAVDAMPADTVTAAPTVRAPAAVQWDAGPETAPSAAAQGGASDAAGEENAEPAANRRALADLTKTEWLVMALYAIVTAFLLFLLVVLFQ